MARMMGSPMRRDDISIAYSHPSPGYGSSRYSRTYSNLSSSSHADEEESSNPESTPPPRTTSRFAPRPPSSPCLNKLSMKKNVNVTAAHVNPEDEGMLHRYRNIVDAKAFCGNSVRCFITNIIFSIFNMNIILREKYLYQNNIKLSIRKQEAKISTNIYLRSKLGIISSVLFLEKRQGSINIEKNLIKYYLLFKF